MKPTIIFFILSLILPPALYAENIIVFGNESKPPKFWLDSEGPHGILVDILRSTEQELGVSFDIQGYPWARAYLYSIHGEGAIVGLSKTDERLELFDYSTAIYNDPVIMVVKRGKEFVFNDLTELQGKRVAACRGCSYGPAYEKLKKNLILVEDNNNISRLKMLLIDRVDVAIINPGSYALKQICQDNPDLNYEDFSVLPKPLTIDTNHLSFSKTLNRKKFINRFDRIFMKKLESGEIQNIINSYYD